MFQIITIIIAIVSFIMPFVVYPMWSWIPLALIDVFIVLQFLLVRKKYRFNFIPELSSEANGLLDKFGHYFAMPFASKDFSSSSATSQFAGIILTIICCIQGFWWSIALAAINWFVMGFVASSLSPVSLLNNQPDLNTAYEEVVEYFNAQRQMDSQGT